MTRRKYGPLSESAGRSSTAPVPLVPKKLFAEMAESAPVINASNSASHKRNAVDVRDERAPRGLKQTHLFHDWFSGPWTFHPWSMVHGPSACRAVQNLYVPEAIA